MLSAAEIEDAADPRAFVGRAPEQVMEFLAEVVEPLLAGTDEGVEATPEIRV